MLASCVLCILNFSCSSDDDPAVDVSISPSSISLHYQDTKQLSGTNINKWTSEDIFVASVNDQGLVQGGHVGETRICGQSGNQKTYCDVTITPKYQLYDEPVLDWGSSMSKVKSRENHSLVKSSDNLLVYDYSKGSCSTLLTYGFENGVLKDIVAFLPFSYYLTATYYLAERFQAIHYDGDLSVMYVDALEDSKIKTAVLQSESKSNGSTITSIYYVDYKTIASKTSSKSRNKVAHNHKADILKKIEPIMQDSSISPIINKMK